MRSNELATRAEQSARVKYILAVDPGTTESAYLKYDGDKILGFGKIPNEELFLLIAEEDSNVLLAIEMVASFGMPVGREVFETCVWIGKFEVIHSGPVRRLFRKTVVAHICGDVKAKDVNIRAALVDMFGGSLAIGNKKKPGVCYGISKDMWSALAIAVTAFETE